jgi:hypothetical protein
MPIKYSVFLNDKLDWSYAEIDSRKKYLKWEEVSINWEKVTLTWDEVFIILDLAGRSGAYTDKDYIDGNPWQQVKKDFGEEKTKKIIKVYCRIKGIDYEQTKEPIEDIKITINEFKRFIKEAINVKVGF